MNIVFLNRLEKTEGKAEERGQVFIGEEQGNWTTGWRQIEPQAESESQEQIWYEGVSWEELLAAFRHGVAGKLIAGFRPLLDGLLEETPYWDRKPTLQLLLPYYAELKPEGELAAKLKLWRKAKSQAEGRTAYLIATNKEIQLLAALIPKTSDELMQIPGFGKIKVERYGADLIEIMKDEPRSHSFPLDWVSQTVDPQAFQVWWLRQREEKFGKALASIRDKKLILAAIRDGRSLAEMEKLLESTRRRLVEKIERLDEEGYDVMPLVDKELGEVTEQEWAQVQGAIAKLGDGYLKPLLKEVYGEPAEGDQELEKRYEKLRMMRIRFRKNGQAAV